MLRKLYDWTLSVAAHRHARWWLAAISFAESSFFPVPPDVALMPMVLAERKRAFEYALICTIASVLGGIAGYAIGYFLFDTLGAWILDVYGYHEKFAAVQGSYNAYGAWIVFTAGLTPIPYKIFTIASGVTQLNLAVFFIASCAARGLRFFAVAALLWWFGPPIRAFIDKYFGLLSILFVILLIGGFLAVSLVL
ncbi:DedA family protein [Tepidicaulis marinus]|jgi:membrane protein YqaA with SNARE-associated domain|uniref:DedA family protein n=1 Tax=Tepidicaulis marinus TaxID=1333998 RepID=A0A081BBS6_9HYPH|nr:YqaA family protein [Tepidicaulis marinus]GAK45494.1 DedA family protein [Tepidicaulis marinus]